MNNVDYWNASIESIAYWHKQKKKKKLAPKCPKSLLVVETLLLVLLASSFIQARFWPSRDLTKPSFDIG